MRMLDINTCEVMGVVANNPRLTKAPSGTLEAKFSVMHTRHRTGTYQTDSTTTSIPVMAWGGVADVVERHGLRAGDPVFVVGELRNERKSGNLFLKATEIQCPAGTNANRLTEQLAGAKG